MSEIDRAIEYVAGLDPAFPRAIKGGTPQEVAQLESLISQPLPALYKEFLLRLGHSMDWISIQQADFSIGAVTGFYRTPKWTVPPRFQLIALPTLDSAYALYLAGGRVVSFPEPYEGEDVEMSSILPVAGSLHEMIGTRAFRQWHMNKLPHGFRVYQDLPSPDGPEAAARVLAPLGFSPLWFANDWVCACEGENAAAVISKGVNSVLVVDCASADPAILHTAGEALTRGLGMKSLAVPDYWRQG